MSARNESQYRGKVILAPMVRVGTLPMRLLALDYGADLVYSEEIIDRKILMCQKYENELLGTTDFKMADGTVVFQTTEREKPHVIFQFGTADAKRALAAAKKIQNYVAGVDINMGCPKEFSIKGGMGAALIYQPEKVREILTLLVKELSVPVTCKIRVLPSLEETIKLAKVIESTGVSALAVHGRTKEERPRHPVREGYIKAVAQAVGIPVIANGGSLDMNALEDVKNFQQASGASSVMVARAAMWNCSVFRKEGRLPYDTVLREYLRYAFKYDNHGLNTKYCVLQCLHDKMTELGDIGERCLAAKSLYDFADIWNMKSEYESVLKEREQKEAELRQKSQDPNLGVKKRKTDDGLVLIELPVRYDKSIYSPNMTPKQVLYDYCKRCRFEKPLFETAERQEDRLFNSTVLVDCKRYTNPHWEKSKQLAEQGAAISCLVSVGQHDSRLSEPAHEDEYLRRKWRSIITQDSLVENKDSANQSANNVNVT